MSVQFIQVNARNLSETIEKIAHDGYYIGFEILEEDIIDSLSVNIDPQHGGVTYSFGGQIAPENKSAAKWLLEKIHTISPLSDEVYVLPSKLDLDCIVAAILWAHSLEVSTWGKTTQEWEKLAEIVDTIDTVDCGLGNIVGNEWNPDHQKSQLLHEVTWYQIISAFLADFKVPLEEKIEKVWQWLLDGNLSPFETYERQVRREALEQKQSKIDNIYGVTVVESNARGATGLIYAHAPFGIAFNSQFPTKDGSIAKYTICQFTADKYIDLAGILAEISQLEEGWGGNLQAGIIGSPFAGTSLKLDTVCEIVSRHVK